MSSHVCHAYSSDQTHADTKKRTRHHSSLEDQPSNGFTTYPWLPPHLERVVRLLDAPPRAPVLEGPLEEAGHVVREGVEELDAAIALEPGRRRRDAAPAARAGHPAAHHVRLQQAVRVRVSVIVGVMVVVVVADVVVGVAQLMRGAGGGGGGGEEEPEDVRRRGVLHGRLFAGGYLLGAWEEETGGGVRGIQVREPCGALVAQMVRWHDMHAWRPRHLEAIHETVKKERKTGALVSSEDKVVSLVDNKVVSSVDNKAFRRVPWATATAQTKEVSAWRYDSSMQHINHSPPPPSSLLRVVCVVFFLVFFVLRSSAPLQHVHQYFFSGLLSADFRASATHAIFPRRRIGVTAPLPGNHSRQSCTKPPGTQSLKYQYKGGNARICARSYVLHSGDSLQCQLRGSGNTS